MENDVPQILPRDRSNAYEIFLAARNAGKTIWLSHRRNMILVSRQRPAPDFTRMACVDRTEGEAA